MSVSNWPPDPEPGGSLGPPDRRPPTAVGVMTPPPPPGTPRYRDHLSRLRRRLAEGFVGAVLTTSAVGVGTLGGVAAILGAAGLGAAGVALLYRAFRFRDHPKRSVVLALMSAARRYRKGKRAA